jgi:hypothetical protein
MSIGSVSSIQTVNIPVPPGESNPRAVLSPDWAFAGIMPPGKAPRIYRYGLAAVDLGIYRPAVAIDFRPRPSVVWRPDEVRDANAEVAVAFGRGSRAVERFDLELECALQSLPLRDATCVTHSDDGKYVAAGSVDGTIGVWRLGNRGVVEEICERPCDHPILRVALSANSDMVFFTTAHGQFQSMVVQPGAVAGRCMSETCSDGSPFNFQCYTVSCHPKNNALVAFGGDSKIVYLVNYGNGNVRHIQSEVGDCVREVRFLPTLRHISILGELGVEVYDILTLERVKVLPIHDGVALTARQYFDNLHVAVASPGR